MSFLGDQTLTRLLEAGFLRTETNEVIAGEEHLDEGSISLKVGPEAYTTTDPECRDRKLIQLRKKQLFNIESGQFALLITDEIVTIPQNLLGFITLNTRFKYRGLINVSGFHVNPGWKGRLVFTVYNAGPHSVPIRYQDPAFRIWLSTIKNYEENYAINADQVADQINIDSDKIYNLDGDIFSPHVLANRIRNFERATSLKWTVLLLTLIIGVLVGLAGNVATSFVQKITGDNRIYLKEELKAEIKDEIVDEALKQLQDLSPEQKSKIDETAEKANQNKE